MNNIILKDNYYYLNEQKFPRISMILSTTESKENKDRLRKWQHKMNELHGEKKAEELSQNRLQEGTDLHKLIENYLSETEILFDIYYEAASDRIKSFFESIRPYLDLIDCNKKRQIEKILFSQKYGFAGTCDLIMKYRGKNCIFDWTTSTSKKRREFIQRKFLQCAAYAIAYEEMYQIPIEQLIVIVIRTDGYQEFIEHPKELKFEFLERLELFHRNSNSLLSMNQ